MNKLCLLLVVYFIKLGTTTNAQNLYFPPINNASQWDTISPMVLGWCTKEIEPLYSFLDQENTKGFIVLKDGKIVLEKYFGTFTKDSLWYWASAGKTLTSFLIGKAQEEKLLSINDLSSKYLGQGWTNCTADQEDKIKIWNQLTMTSGLDDGVSDNHCTDKICLNYKADAGQRWAYHNAPYTLLEKVLVQATGMTLNNYTFNKLSKSTGINGAWAKVDFDNIFFSKVRNMARYGLLVQNHCIWNKDTTLSDESYIEQMSNTSQSLNPSYGYLWWLNGKTSFKVPTSQIDFPGPIAPHAPSDMFAGIGKNGQIVSIARSKGLVIVRMGNASDNGEVSIILVDKIWEKLNAVICANSTHGSHSENDDIVIYPNPIKNILNINLPNEVNFQIYISNLLGKVLVKTNNTEKIDLSCLVNGVYHVIVQCANKTYIKRIVKLN
ncbi:MAG: serine hydrolase [Saprospiraceae bacterium]